MFWALIRWQWRETSTTSHALGVVMGVASWHPLPMLLWMESCIASTTLPSSSRRREATITSSPELLPSRVMPRLSPTRNPISPENQLIIIRLTILLGTSTKLLDQEHYKIKDFGHFVLVLLGFNSFLFYHLACCSCSCHDGIFWAIIVGFCLEYLQTYIFRVIFFLLCDIFFHIFEIFHWENSLCY